jgi:demethylmenaquinone methyltransferase/2-methoxy-6-polyprenyl-1,4-benzoquinol methylase
MSEAGKYYDPGRDRAKRVEELFARIAPRYDLINDLQSAGLHRLWKRRLVRLAALPRGGSALDLCCGTGDITLSLARGYPQARAIVGLDFTMPMLRVAASRRAPASPMSAWLRADALRIPAPAGSFDCVTIAYGLRNVADIDACLREIRRVLRPGGRLLVLDFGKPPNRFVARLYFSYLRAAVPLFGRLFFGDRDTHGYIYDSLLRYPSQEETAARLRAVGFARVRVENPLLGIMGLVVGEAVPD